MCFVCESAGVDMRGLVEGRGLVDFDAEFGEVGGFDGDKVYLDRFGANLLVA